MKFALLCAIVLSAATAAAETVIIEYPDHYYVESTGTAEAKSAPSREGSAPPARTVPAPEQESRAPAVAARPVTNFDNDPQPVAPAERRASMEKEIQRLQGLRSELMTPREGETADQAERRQREAEGKLRKINRLSSELLKIAPGQ
ncbi:hypothetical protein [Geobacter sp. AOG1]|uniref:hypothetical protein n=1 Tax=Geobacter sp. AOG1 TaxID=1566346 RepID=UPI001CC7099A|nr:hypothetical protein [Geobacter sp. AOG1]GFE58076.1 hypothetical protein AOG1_19560 [Geobacter sp. AOG1]